MATVVSRIVRSSPHRNGVQTWEAIVELLAQSSDDNRKELMSVIGVAASLITDRCPKNAPIVVTCEGPRTRIYCTYDEDAIDGTGENEDVLGFDPLNGSWAVSLPCQPDDLGWVQSALKKHSSRITARDLNSDSASSEKEQHNRSQTLIIDPKGFLEP